MFVQNITPFAWSRKTNDRIARAPADGRAAIASSAPHPTATNLLPAPTLAPSTEPSPQRSTPIAQQIEIFSWWTAPAAIEAFNALIQLYGGEHPGYQVVNAAADSAASLDTFEIFRTRLPEGKPPDSWLVHAGKESL